MKSKWLIAMMLMTSGALKAQSGYRIVNTFHIRSGGGWDYIAVHDDRLFVSHGTQVNVLGKTTGDSLGVIPGTTGVHGIAFDDVQGKGFTSNGRLNNVFVFDLKSLRILDSVRTGTNPDAIMYEPYTRSIITCNGRSHDLTLIDPVTDKVKGTITVSGKPETAAGDGQGKLFVNIEDRNEIAVVDLAKGKMIAAWPLQGAEGPTGLVFDKELNLLFTGCDKQLVVLNASTGQVVGKVPIGEGCDGVAMDHQTKTIFTSNGESATLSVVGRTNNNQFDVLQTLATQPGARTITLDEATHILYLPTARFEENGSKTERPKMIPGSFSVLVIGK